MCLLVSAREEIEYCTSPVLITQMYQNHQRVLTQLYQQINTAHLAGDYQQLKQLTIKLSYYHNLEKEIYRKMPVK